MRRAFAYLLGVLWLQAADTQKLEQYTSSYEGACSCAADFSAPSNSSSDSLLAFSRSPVSHSFGAFSLGALAYQVSNTKGYENTRYAVLFGLKRGILLGGSGLMLNAFIDGAIGAENKNGLYLVSSGVEAGYRLGRVMLSLGGGLMMSTLARPEIPKEQYNIYGGIFSVGVFFDIARGYGVNLTYTGGSKRSKKLVGERFDTQGLMLSLSYYDFSI